MNLAGMRMRVQSEMERRQLEADATDIYEALQWYLKRPDWETTCDSRVLTIYNRAHEIAEAKAKPVIPWHERAKGPPHEEALRLTEILSKALESEVLTFESVISCLLHLSTKRDSEGRSAWARQCPDISYPLTEEQSKKIALECARLHWSTIENSVLGREWKFKAQEDWKPEVRAVQLTGSPARLKLCSYA